jgi:Protein of unknown function (DUF4238)
VSLIRPPRRPHTVSQVVLREFTRAGELTMYDSDRQIFITKGPRAGFYMPFDQHDPIGSEELWGEIEKRIPKMYAALNARAATSDPQVEAIVRDVLALHWARSAAMKAVHDRVTEEVKRRSMEKRASEPALLAGAMLESKGLHATSPDALAWFNEDIHSRVVSEHREKWLSDRNAHHVAEAQRIMGRWSVQIGYAPAGSDLMISDAPVVTMKPGHDGLGPHQGVALEEAWEICMPIGPTVLVGLGAEPKTLNLTSEMVDRYNDLQIRARIRWLGCYPSGPSENALRATLPVRGRPLPTP